MVRTLSAMRWRSFAQAHIGVPGRGNRRAATHLIVVSLLQSTLFGGLAITIALGGTNAGLAQAFGVLALLTAGYVGLIAKDRLEADASALEAYATPSEIMTSDVEQLDQLRKHVSHELRTPLNAMIGFSEMMHREMLGPIGNERYREYAAHIRQSAEQFQLATERTLAMTEFLAQQSDQSRPPPNSIGPVDRQIMCDAPIEPCTL